VIAATDRIELAAGVTVRRGRLADEVRGESWPLNGSAAFVLGRVGEPIGVTVREMAESFSLPLETARADVLRFVWHLNRLALVNVESGSRPVERLLGWLRLALRLAPAGSVPASLTRRRPLDTRSALRGLGTCLVASARRSAGVAAVASGVAFELFAAAGSPGAALPLALGICTGLGLGLHEAVHAAMLHGVPSALVTRGRRTFVLHAALSPGRRSLVALAGPLAVAVIGTICLAAAALVSVPCLAVAGCPFAAHALGLTVFTGDGRVACGL
jgi:hypothetical protein